jgi:hypothetical protein
MTLFCISPGVTDSLLPLDRVVVGTLKGEASKRSKRDAVTDMIAAWDMLLEKTLKSTLDVYWNIGEATNVQLSIFLRIILSYCRLFCIFSELDIQCDASGSC